MNRPLPSLQWDVFCRVIDNFGDIGVCWRLVAQLATQGQRVRLWVDDASALQWMAPEGCPGVELRAWGSPPPGPGEAAPDVMVEAFGCDIAPEFIAYSAYISSATGQKHPKPVWINLEYLSAESYVERNHRLPSPILAGPAAGWTRWFFYPGFTPATGGLLREPDLMARREAFDRSAWRATHAAAYGLGDGGAAQRWVSLFCYEPAALPELLRHGQAQPTQLLVTPGRPTAAVQAALHHDSSQISPQRLSDKRGQLSISYLPHRPQPAFDAMLWACDLNLVRGEDSLCGRCGPGRRWCGRFTRSTTTPTTTSSGRFWTGCRPRHRCGSSTPPGTGWTRPPCNGPATTPWPSGPPALQPPVRAC